MYLQFLCVGPANSRAFDVYQIPAPVTARCTVLSFCQTPAPGRRVFSAALVCSFPDSAHSKDHYPRPRLDPFFFRRLSSVIIRPVVCRMYQYIYVLNKESSNYNYETGSMTGILVQLKWESLKKRRKDNRLILLYKGLKGKASVPTNDLIPKTRRCRNQHSMAFQTPIANTDVYKGSFFPQTIRDWNALHDSLISSAEDAEDCVAKFTSLVRARDSFPNHRSW